MNEQLEDVLRRELREVADQLPVPPRPALRQAPARSAQRWRQRPLLVAAAVTLIVGMVAALVVSGAGRSMQPALPPTPTLSPTPTEETAPHDGFTLYVSAAPPHVLIASHPDLPVYDDPAGEPWSGRLLYNDDCECFVLLEDGAAGAVTVVAWLPATEGFTEGGKRGVAHYHAARVMEGEHVEGRGIRIPDCEDTPLRLPASVRRLGPECLVILGVDF